MVFGIGGGYKLNDKWAIGLSNSFYIRSLRFERSTYARFFLNEPGSPMMSSSFVRNADFSKVRYTAKFGINYQDKTFLPASLSPRYHYGYWAVVPPLQMLSVLIFYIKDPGQAYWLMTVKEN